MFSTETYYINTLGPDRSLVFGDSAAVEVCTLCREHMLVFDPFSAKIGEISRIYSYGSSLQVAYSANRPHIGESWKGHVPKIQDHKVRIYP